jgi:hypothetical protein
MKKAEVETKQIDFYGDTLGIRDTWKSSKYRPVASRKRKLEAESNQLYWLG